MFLGSSMFSRVMYSRLTRPCYSHLRNRRSEHPLGRGGHRQQSSFPLSAFCRATSPCGPSLQYPIRKSCRLLRSGTAVCFDQVSMIGTCRCEMPFPMLPGKGAGAKYFGSSDLASIITVKIGSTVLASVSSFLSETSSCKCVDQEQRTSGERKI